MEPGQQERGGVLDLQFKGDRGTEFPGGPVVGYCTSTAGDMNSIPGWGNKIPLATWPKKKLVIITINKGDRWRRQWRPTPVLLLGKSMDGGAW